jgi:hypothetical protein
MMIKDMSSEGLGRGFWLGMVAVFVWCLWRILAGEAWPLDDELSHYQISAGVWSDPSQLLHLWSRPGRNVFHAPVAGFGLEVTRIWTLVLAMVAIWLAASELRRMRVAGLVFLPLLVGFQCWFPELAGTVLTQTPFMLAWIAGVWLAARGRLRGAAVCFGLLGLIRHEGVAISAMWGLWVAAAPAGFLRELAARNWAKVGPAFLRAVELGLWTLLPHMVLNVATFFEDGTWPFLIYFDEKPTEMYGSGPIWHFVPLIVAGAGLPVVLLAAAGMGRIKERAWVGVLYWTYPVYFLLHSVIFWRGMFASGGYYHFLMPMAPWLGIMALAGLGRIHKNSWKYAAVGVVVFLGLLMPQEQLAQDEGHLANVPSKSPEELMRSLRFPAPPRKLGFFQIGVRDGSHWLDENLGQDGEWLSCHVAVSHFRKNDRGRRLGVFEFKSQEAKAKIPVGTLFLWEAKYAPEEDFGWTEEELSKNWEKVKEWANGTVVVYRRVGL